MNYAVHHDKVRRTEAENTLNCLPQRSQQTQQIRTKRNDRRKVRVVFV